MEVSPQQCVSGLNEQNKTIYLSPLLSNFETEPSNVAQVSLELARWPRITSNLNVSCLSLLKAWILGMHHHAWMRGLFFGNPTSGGMSLLAKVLGWRGWGWGGGLRIPEEARVQACTIPEAAHMTEHFCPSGNARQVGFIGTGLPAGQSGRKE